MVFFQVGRDGGIGPALRDLCEISPVGCPFSVLPSKTPSNPWVLIPPSDTFSCGENSDDDRGDMVFFQVGRDGGIRTPDLLLPKQALYQAKLRPV